MDVFPDTWPAQFQKYQKARSDAHIYAHNHGYYEPHSITPIYADGAMAFGMIDDLGYIGVGTGNSAQNDLLVFGDSFAYGYGVNSSKTFAARLHAYNAGVWGEAFPFHSTVFQRVVSVVKPKRAIWVLYPPHLISCTPGGWNTRKTINPTKYPIYAFLVEQFNKTKCSTLILKATGWGYNREDYYSLEWSLYDGSDDRIEAGYSSFENAVTAVQTTAKERGVQIVALFVPSKTQIALELSNARPLLYRRGPLDANLATNRMESILEKHGISRDCQINLMELIRQTPEKWESYYFKTDAHFNETGSAAIAEFIAMRLKGNPLRDGEKVR